MNNQNKNNQIIIYNTKNRETKIEARIKDETVWLLQKQMAELFDKDIRTINEHIKYIFRARISGKFNYRGIPGSSN